MPTLQQARAPVAGDEIIGIADDGHGQQERIVRIIGLGFDIEPIKHDGTLQVVHHDADACGLHTLGSDTRSCKTTFPLLASFQ
jgi:hypothetical protein